MTEAEPLLPAPRERHVLIGQGRAAAALAEAEASGRLHHAWLLGGPKGIGKATLAFRFARFLLASSSERRGGEAGLGVDPDSRTARQVAAGSHPNLVVLDLAAANADVDKPPARSVPVKTARRALAFFGSTAADAGRRICIVDSIDDLTPQAANALLKTVEEPPPGALILLVSHAPEQVLPTIRSRCRKLRLSLLQPDDVEEVLISLRDGLDGADRGVVARAAAASEGSVDRALALLDEKRLGMLDELGRLLDALPRAPMRGILRMADRLGDKRGGAEFSLAVDRIQRWLAERVEAGQHLGPARLAPLAEVCENVAEAARTLEVYNLDRRAFIVSTFGELAEAVRRAA